VVIRLERGTDCLHMVQLMPLPAIGCGAGSMKRSSVRPSVRRSARAVCLYVCPVIRLRRRCAAGLLLILAAAALQHGPQRGAQQQM